MLIFIIFIHKKGNQTRLSEELCLCRRGKITGPPESTDIKDFEPKLDQNAVFWQGLKNNYDHITPNVLFSYYLELMNGLEPKFLMFQDVHPVMALRTLITNFYNPIRISKFAKVVKEFFATTYFSASKHIRQLIDEMAENSMADSIEIQWVAYFIILSFNNTPNPKNRQKMLDPEWFGSFLHGISAKITDDIQNVFNEGDNKIINLFDDRLKKVADLNDFDLPLLPVPGGDLKFLLIFENICKNTPAGHLTNIIERFHKSTLSHRRGGLHQAVTDKFMPEILPKQFIELLTDLYYETLEENLSEIEFHSFKAVSKVYEILLDRFFLSQFEEIPYYEFQKICKSEGLLWDNVEELILKVGDLASKKDFDHKSGRLRFDQYLKLFKKPLLFIETEAGKQYKYRHIVFSWPIIFDAYLAHITHFLQNSAVGKARGKLLEDSVALIVNENLFAEPFKIIVVNSALPQRDPQIQKMFNQTKDFIFSRYVVRVDPADLSHQTFRFREYDVCYYFNERLYFIETKDNLAIETYDQPHLALKWLLNNLKRIREKEKVLKIPAIKAKLEQMMNLPIKNVKGIFLSNIAFGVHRVYTVGEFKNYLSKLQNRLEYDPIRENTLQILRGKIRQAEIFNDTELLGQNLRKAFDLTMSCGLWDDAAELGMKLLSNIEQTSQYADKLLLSLRLSDALGHKQNYFEALKVLNRVQSVLNANSEPDLAAFYYFKRGQWLKELAKKEDALEAFLESERISRKVLFHEDYFVVLYANIIDFYPDGHERKRYFLEKVAALFPDEKNLESFIKDILVNARFTV